MSTPGYILALDQGTTGTTAMLIDSTGMPLWTVNREIRQIYPQPGWVEHDPTELFESCLHAIEDLLDMAEAHPRSIVGLGITNQRETIILWDRRTGEPLHNAIVWQCRRTAPLCDELKNRGLEEWVREKTGLPMDPYFSATKLRWLLDNVPDAQRRAENGELACGTVDSWLMWNFSNKLVHATDTTNASTTMLFNINTLEWDSELLDLFDIPRSLLPEVRSASEIYGYVVGDLSAGQPIPIAGVAGDQQASTFGQACFTPGDTKNTYGTGCFFVTNTGSRRVDSSAGLVPMVGWTLNGETTYALEGAIFSAGATVQWLRDELGIISSSAESESVAAEVEDNGGVYFVPAFSGLGTPYWDMYARGAIVGLTRGANRSHITRAALEAIAYQTRDLMDAVIQDTGLALDSIRVDGGATNNELLMKFQADILGIPVHRSTVKDATSLGVGWLAGLGVGFWDGTDQLSGLWSADRIFEPSMSDPDRTRLYGQWQNAVERSRNWAV